MCRSDLSSICFHTIRIAVDTMPVVVVGILGYIWGYLGIEGDEAPAI